MESLSEHLIKKNEINIINEFVELNEQQRDYLMNISPDASLYDYYNYYKSENLLSITNEKIYTRNSYLLLNSNEIENYRKICFGSMDLQKRLNLSNEKVRELLKSQMDYIKSHIEKYGINHFENTSLDFMGYLISNRSYNNIENYFSPNINA